MNYPAAELRSIKMNFYFIKPDAEHRGILLIKRNLKIILVGNCKHCQQRYMIVEIRLNREEGFG